MDTDTGGDGGTPVGQTDISDDIIWDRRTQTDPTPMGSQGSDPIDPNPNETPTPMRPQTQEMLTPKDPMFRSP